MNNEHHNHSKTTPERTMHLLAKTKIYLLVAFIFVQLFHCIDTNDESVTVAVDIKETTTQGDGTSTTETITIKQTATAAAGTVENITLAPEHRSAIEICNETFPTPKGTVR